MKIAIYSDLHHEHLNGTPIPTYPTDADVVVLAGDIDSEHRGVLWAAANYKQPVLYVAGNHEHYGKNLRAVLVRCREAAANTNVRFLENNVVFIGGVRFVGCTLWTDFELWGDDQIERAQRHCGNFLTDFRVIGYGRPDRSSTKHKLKPGEMRAIHLASRQWLDEMLAQPFDGPTVVITHHLPSLKCVNPRFLIDEQERLFSAAFASNVDGLIERHQPELWIHGHTHDCVDVTIGTTRIVANPGGYPREPNPGFKRAFDVELQ
jgi:Icc-related predicted phosphoesterase